MKSTYLITVLAVVSWVGCATAPPDNSAAFQHGLTDIFANATQEQPYKIAVLPLVDFRSETQDALSSYLSSDVIFEITRSFPDRFTILERDLIESILTEFEFSLMSGMISEEEVAQFGRMSGADYLIIGTKLELTETIQVNLRLVDVESAEIIGVARIDLAMEEKYATLIDGTAVASGNTVDEQPTTPSVGGPEESGGAPDDLPGLAFNEGELVAEFSFEEWPAGLDYGDGVRIDEGTIHARAPVGAGTGWMIPATISEPGVVSFDLRLGEMINEDHPPIHVNLYRDESQRVCLMFGSEFLISFQNFDGRSENGREYELTLPVGNWAHIDLVLDAGYVSAYVNGAAVGTIEITDEITRSGNLLFECHNEFWIDNLAIRRVDAVARTRPGRGAQTGHVPSITVDPLFVRHNYSDTAIEGANRVASLNFDRSLAGIEYDVEGVSSDDASVHARADVGGATHWQYREPFGRPSVVSFDITLGEHLNENHAMSHINLFVTESYRICVMIDRGSIASFVSINGEHSHPIEHGLGRTLRDNRSAHIDLVSARGTVAVYVDDELIAGYPFGESAAPSGYLSFECHNEYWIDNLEITRFDSLLFHEIEPIRIDQTVIGRFDERGDVKAYALPVRAGREYEIRIYDEWSGYDGHADVRDVRLYLSDHGNSVSDDQNPIFQIDREHRGHDDPLRTAIDRSGFLIVTMRSGNPGNTSFELAISERH